MIKRAYGFVDASRGFYLKLRKTLEELGCVVSKHDPAMYIFHDDEGEVDGLILTHVDDLLYGSGSVQFEEKVMKPLKEIFTFGSKEEADFKYVGMQVTQQEGENRRINC